MPRVNEILLGDAYELIKTIPDKSIDCLYTDIPYDIPGIHSGAGFLSERKFKDEIAVFSEGVSDELWDEVDRVLRDDFNMFVWCSIKQIPHLLHRYATEKGLNFNILVWCKTNATPFVNNTWKPDLEYCLHFQKGARLNDGIHLKSKYFVSGTNKDDKKRFVHPTIKPLELVERHILHATQPGDMVLDPFMGSGTTALACKHTGRNYIGFEIDPEFYKIATDRLNGVDVHGTMSLLDTDFDKLEPSKPQQLSLFDETGGKENA